MLSAAICHEDDADSSGKEPEYTSLIGYWVIKEGASYAKKADGSTITTATIKPGTVANEFFADGKFTGHDLTGSFPAESGTWALTVGQLDGQDIESGTLSLISPSSKEAAGELFFEADGSMRFEISSINAPVGGGPPIISLKTKTIEGYPHAENWAVYVYEKKR